jgi:Tfp pilus assembly protein PilX
MIKLRPLKQLRNNEQGMILVAVVIISAVLTVIGLTLTAGITSQYTLASNDLYATNADMLAEAGVEESVEQLNQNDNFAGYPSPQQFFNNATQGNGVFTATIVNTPDGNAKTITSTGKVYRLNNPSKPVSTRIVKVTVVGTSSGGYSVQSGPGGLILGGSANITNSQVYVNGTLTMSGASKIGTVSQPLQVDIANDACPTGASPGPTYPQICTSTQPISFSGSPTIYGSVCATGQTSSSHIQTGNGGQGLEPGCTAPLVTMPTYDRTGQINAVTTTKPSTDSSIDCTRYVSGSGFSRTWPSNLKITGNIDVGSSCDLTLSGNVYITGNLTIDGAAKIHIPDSLGTTRPVIIVDGTITVGGSASMLANSSGTGAEFFSFKSSASCNPNCTSLSGNDLKTSQGLQTISIGGAAKLAGMIFDAYWGKVVAGGSGNVGSVIGQTVDLSGAGTITFGTYLSSGARTWTITSYQHLYH